MLFAALPTWQRRALRGLVGLVLALVALLLIVWIALPWWIEGRGVRMASEQLGRPVSLTAAHFKPWRLALSLEGLRIGGAPAPAGAASSPDLLSVKEIEVAVSPRSLWHFAPVLSSLRVDTPVVRLASLGEGRTDIDDILARFASAPKPATAEPANEPDLAIYNIELLQGDFQLDDRQAGMVHHLSGLTLGVPFISTLDADVEVQVLPHLSGQLNGVAFKTDAQAEPFAATRSASVQFKLDGLDLSAYRAYWPRQLPMRLASGKVDAQLTLDFKQPLHQAPELKLSGQADLRELSLQRRGGAAGQQAEGWEDLLRWKQLSVDLADVQPLRHQILLNRVALQGPEVTLSRDAQGRVWMPMAEAPAPARTSSKTASAANETPAATAVASASGASGAASGITATAKTSASPWRFGLRQLEVADGRLVWRDASVQPAGAWRVDALSVKGSGIAWPLATPAAPIELSATLTADGLAASASAGPAAPTAGTTKAASGKTAKSAGTMAGAKAVTAAAPADAKAANLHAKGQLGPDGIALDWGLEQLQLGWLGPYLRAVTPLRVDGRLALQGHVKAGPQGQDPHLGLKDLRLDQLQLIDGGKPVVSLAELSLDQADLAVASHQVTLGRLSLKQPKAELARDAAGRWNWAGWMAAGDRATPAAAGQGASVGGGRSAAASSKREGAASDGGSPWSARLAELSVEGGQVQLLDKFSHVLDDEPARAIGVQDLALRVSNVDWDGRQLRQAIPARLSMNFRRPDATRRNARDIPRLQWDGQVAMAPVRVNGKLTAEHLPLHWADPYLDPSIGIHLQRLEGSYKGDFALALQPQGPRLQATGDILLADLRLRQARLQDGHRRSAEDLLSWQALRLAGFKLQLAPAGVPDIAIRQASLDEFYARLIINEQGRLNLRDLRQTEQGQAVAAVAGTAAASAPVAAVVASARAAPEAATTASAPASGAAASPPVRLSIADTRVNAGKVDFNDRFIKPNYSATLTELTGTLGGFTAGSDAMAPLKLTGRVAGTGLLDISGQLNPSGAPLALDITASATDIELAPLSPYAGKYAGFAIERGKLSTRVHYQIDPNGRLVADNKIVLNQLSFGDPIDSPEATKLPVRLAVALLKDSNGVIDLNLPVSGSINDPQFSIGGVVVKLIVNLLTKAITAPFSLLSGGGGADLSHMDFAPGTAALPAGSEAQLDKVAKALTDKPVLQVSITGWVDPAGERRAAQAAKLEEALVAERRRELRRQQDPSAAAPAASAPITLDDTQRQRLLKSVYDGAKLPNKPRNFIGLAKDLPADQMRNLLMDSYTISDEQMRELALQRSVAVRDALIARGVPNARLFLASPKLHETQAGEGGKEAWQPKVDLALSAQ